TPALAGYVGRTLLLEGTIGSEPDPGLTTTSYRINVDHVFVEGEWLPVEGSVRATLHQYADYRYGDRVQIEGRLREPPVFEDFDYRAYLARQGVVATMLHPEVVVVDEGSKWNVQALSIDLRLALERSLQRSLPEPEASLGAGIAFGRDAYLPRDLYDDFRTTGLAHLVAVSGSNVSLVGALAFLVLAPLLGRRWAIAPAALLIVSYVLVAGMSASVVRAGIMAVVFLAGAALGRQQSALAALGLAAVAMTAVQPGAAQDIGFQLSLAATAGLIVFGPWIRHLLEAGLGALRLQSAVPGIVVEAAALTLSATAATLPIMWVNFGEISVVGPFTNMVAGPVFAMTFVLSLATAVVGLAWADGGWLLGLATYYPLAGIVWLGESAATVPGASVSAPETSGTFAAGCYALMALVGWPAYRYLAPSRPPRRRGPAAKSFRRLSVAAGVGAIVFAAVPVSLLPISGPGQLDVTLLDVGQGDAILVRTPAGRTVLVDGGPSGIGLARELGAVLPHWQRRIDVVLLTHPDEDHLAGLPHMLERLRTGAVADPGVTGTTTAYEIYALRSGARQTLAAGASFELDGVTFDVLWPPEGYESEQTNNHSLVLRITYGETVILLTGDIEASAQRQLLRTADVRADILQVPHHGSKNSAVEFLSAVEAEVAVISVGEGNRYGHPAPEILDALGDTVTLRTDLDGRVSITSDGTRVRIRAER
ncbi:MAG TPA: ComEC/Rec2 family competence protein, partial [Tepidiformaceae bacterium]